MNLTPHFTLAEFTDSDTAARLGIDNSMPATLLVAATNTCDLLEQIRDRLAAMAGRPVPIIVTSGYRCPALNTVIGSGPGSDHPRAMAADFKAPAFGTPYEVAQALAPLVDEMGIGQLIHEYGRWVHVSTRLTDKDVNRIITISKAGTRVGVEAVA